MVVGDGFRRRPIVAAGLRLSKRELDDRLLGLVSRAGVLALCASPSARSRLRPDRQCRSERTRLFGLKGRGPHRKSNGTLLMWWTLMDSNHRAVRTWFTARRNRPTLPSVRSAKRTPRYLAPREGVEPPTLQAACSQSSHSSAGTGSTQVDPVSGLSLRLRRPALFSTELTRRCHLGCVRTRPRRGELG